MTVDEKTYKRLPDHLKALFVKAPNPGSDEVLEAFAAFGERKSSGVYQRGQVDSEHTVYCGPIGNGERYSAIYADTGTAARFFYTAKASKTERGDGNNHPTVKPLTLMMWLVRLVTPPGGICLDPFSGSGTTGMACVAADRDCVMIEREPAYCEIIRRRMKAEEDKIPLFHD